MNILLLKSIPRKTGYTEKMTDHFKRGIAQTDASLKEVDILTRDIKLCKGCYVCWTKTPGRCIYRDAMDELLNDFLRADIVMLATPLYHYTMNCEMFRFFERTLPLSIPTFEHSSDGVMKNGVRYPERWSNKKIGLITCGGFKGEENFSAMIQTFELIANGLNLDICGILIRPESYLLPFKLAKPKTIATIEKAFEKAGLELGRDGCISKDTADRAKTPIVGGADMYTNYADIYFDYAAKAYEKGVFDEKEIVEKVMKDPVILMQELASYIDPVATAKVRAIMYFHFTDIALRYTLHINRGKCELVEGTEPDKYDLLVETDSKTWGDMFLRDIHPRTALMNKQILLKGEKGLFAKIDKYFPPPSD